MLLPGGTRTEIRRKESCSASKAPTDDGSAYLTLELTPLRPYPLRQVHLRADHPASSICHTRFVSSMCVLNQTFDYVLTCCPQQNMARRAVSSGWNPSDQSPSGQKSDLALPRARGRSSVAQVQPLQNAETKSELVRSSQKPLFALPPLTSSQLSRRHRAPLHTQHLLLQLRQRLDILRQDNPTTTPIAHQTHHPHGPLPYSSVRLLWVQRLVHGRRLESRLRPLAAIHWP